MAALPNRTPRAEVHFPPNSPVTLALKYAQGKLLAGTYGERVLFTTTDNRVFFVSPEVAGQIEAAGVNVREPFTVTLRWDGGKDSPRTWEVAKLAAISPAVGQQQDGTFVVPAAPNPSSSEAPARKPPAMANADARREDGASILIAESIAMVDAFAVVLKHALETYQGRVKPDEVRAIFLTTAINVCGGKRHAA